MDIASFLGSLAVSSPPLFAGFLLGVITSISPCPLGSNLAAIAVLSRNSKSHKGVAMVSLAYSAGRSLTYLIASAIVGFAGAAAFQVFAPLQSHYNLVLSLMLAIAGFMLWGKLGVDFSILNSEKIRFLADKGIGGAFLLGAGLALVFCPVSAALFLGGVIPLVVSTKDWLLIPIVYGLGTAVPVFVLPQVVHATKKAGNYIGLVGSFGQSASKLLGVVFILASAYYLLRWLGL